LNDSLLATLNKELKRCSESDIVPGAASVLGFFISHTKHEEVAWKDEMLR
jgi:hypothetical protein